jgi:threonine dehydratase
MTTPVSPPAPAAAPDLPAIEAAARALEALTRVTPVTPWDDPELRRRLGEGTRVLLKLELFQHTGTFKVRGALTVMGSLDPEALARGVTAVSAGNHAVAVAFAAARLKTTARVVMPRTASPARVALCRAWGADVVLADTVTAAFEETRRIERDEGRTFVHPFEGPLTALGTATLGLELIRQAPDLDAVIVPVGGGGLAAGVSTAIKLAAPRCQVLGVEPRGADSMTRSFAAGEPVAAGIITTIADSLAPPFSLPYSFGLCRRHLDDLVLVDDDELCRSLALIFQGAKLAVEPAGAASTAALLGPLRDRLAGLKVGLIVCGSNIDRARYSQYLERGGALLDAS